MPNLPPGWKTLEDLQREDAQRAPLPPITHFHPPAAKTFREYIRGDDEIHDFGAGDLEEAWNAALEAAARLIERESDDDAKRIRALKSDIFPE